LTRLVVDDGPHSSLSLPLIGETLIGRDRDSCQLILDRDPGVSRRHARISVENDTVWIYQDLGSANGSWLVSPDGQRRRLTERHVLADGDRIELGATALLFREEVAGSNTLVMPGLVAEGATLVHAHADWPTEVAYVVERGGAGRTVRLGFETTLGRARECELIVDAADVSRRHAEIRFEDGRFVLHDLGSANGTFLLRDDRLRRLAGPTPLQSGDAIVLGSCHFGFVDTSAPSAAPAPAPTEELKIDIDQAKASRDAAQVMDTEYFKALRARAQSMRRRAP
jgi:pSer/pThr/pTyr-binding forkhead associated (FHA) protein